MQSRPQDRMRDEMAYSHHIGIAATHPRYSSSPNYKHVRHHLRRNSYMRTLLSFYDDNILGLR